MVGSTFPCSDPLTVAVADDVASGVPIGMDVHVASSGRSRPRSRHNHATVLAPRKAPSSSSSRALRTRAGPSLIADSDPVIRAAPAATANLSASADGGRPTTSSSARSISASFSGRSASASGTQPTGITTRTPPARGVPVAAITGAAVSGTITLAVILALVYFLRIRRRVKRMKRCTNILGPELAPMSPSQSSRLSIDSFAKPDGMRSIASPSTSDPTRQFLPLRASTIISPTSVEQRPREPRSPLRISTTMIGPPPAAARRGSIPSLEPRSPIRSSLVTMTWPSPTPTPTPTSRSGNYPETSDPTRRSIPLRASTVASPTSTAEQHPREPRSPLRTSTTMIGPPPAAARRGSIPSLEPRSPIRSSLVTMTWPPSPSRPSNYPEHHHGEPHAHD